MVTLATVARNLVVVAAVSFLWSLQTFFWPILPLGYEGSLALGGIVFLLGTVLSLIALVMAIIVLTRSGRTRSHVALCVWSGGVLAAFILFGSADLLLTLFRHGTPII